MTDPDQADTLGDGATNHPAAFSIAVQSEHGGVRVTPRGELDLATVEHLERELRELTAAGFPRISIDLRGVGFLDSTGLTALLEAHARAQRDGWELSIIPGPPAVQHVFRITATLERLPFAVDGHPSQPTPLTNRGTGLPT